MGKVIRRRKLVPYSHKYRNIRIYLPDDYYISLDKRYDVLYMHDGQNLFFDKQAFGGCSWGIMDYLSNLEESEDFSDLIVVGIDNAGSYRMKEYSPLYLRADFFHDDVPVSNPDGALYAEWLVNTIKPFIDKNYRTKPEADHNFLAGSSAGANITLYLALHHSDVFSKFGIFSLADWIFNGSLFDNIQFKDAFFDHDYFIYTGGNEGYGEDADLIGQAYIDSALKLGYNLLKAGLSLNQIHFQIKVGQPHHESAWREVFPEFLSFLYSE